jgi:ketosteroid isomerase-like protein
MQNGHTETLREGYEAFDRGDIDTAIGPFADDIRWENPNAERLPRPGTTTGKDEVRELLEETPKYWSRFEVTPDEFHADGETVIVLGHIDAEAKDTGNDVKAPFVHVWRFDGDQVTRVQLLTDTALVADALDR